VQIFANRWKPTIYSLSAQYVCCAQVTSTRTLPAVVGLSAAPRLPAVAGLSAAPNLSP